MALGNITNVLEVYAGSELAADVIAGATTITVTDPVDWSTDGGVFSFVDGTETQITYTTVDDVTGIVTLAAGLALGHLTGDLVQIQPPVLERYAYVAMEDQDEAVEALVPHSLYDRVPTGLRDETVGDSELVSVGYSDEGRVVVQDVVDREPAVDGTFITPATRPPASTDGLPPAISPTPTLVPGIGMLFVSWTAISNADPVTYEVHLSTTSGFTPGPTTLSTKTGATQAAIRTLPDGTPLDYATPYYVKLIATDADGAAAAGSQASATPVQISSPDIAAASIIGSNILGGTITADLLNAVLEVAGTIETADSGQRVVLDSDGLHLFAADGSTLVELPTDPAKDATFAGELDAAALSVKGLAQFQAVTQVLPNGELHLVGGQPDPSLSPNLSSSYPKAFDFDYAVDGNTVTGTRITHYSATGGSGGATACYYGTVDTLAAGGTHRVYVVEWLASNGHINRSLKLDQGTTVPPVGFGACLVGSTIMPLWLSSGTGILVVGNVPRSSFTLFSSVSTATQPGSTNLDATNAHVIGYGCDGVNPYIFSYSNTTKIPNKIKLTVTGGNATGATTVTAFDSAAVKLFSPGDANNLGDSGGPINVIGAAWDGTNWFVNFSWGNSASTLVGRLLQQYNGSTGTIVAKQEIFLPFAVGYFGGGITYDGTDYYLAGGSSTTTNRRLKGTGLTWDYTLGTKLYAGYTWSDGTHATGISPVATLSMDSGITKAPLMRQTVVVTMPTIPALATQNLLYALFASSTPAGSTLKLQSATTHASTNTSPTVTFLTWDPAGATPSSSTYVSGGTPAKITGDGSTVTSSWKLDASGAMVWTGRTTAQRPGSPATGDSALNTTLSLPEIFDGGGYQLGGNQRDQEDVYDALEALGGLTGFGGRVIGMTTDIDSALANPITYTSQRLSGGAFLVRRTETTSGMMVFTSTAAGGLVGGYNGAQLWSIATNGDWTFIGDTGADANGRPLFNTTGLNHLGWRNAADTAAATFQLVPGTVYVVTITAIISSGSLILAGVNPQGLLNLGRGSSFFRSGGVASVTTRQTATIAVASLSTFTSLPWIGVY